MKISEANRSNLYAAIYEPIVDLRIDRLRSIYSNNEHDMQLFRLNNEIWKRVQAALNLEPPSNDK